jgi:hypothetical protein
LTELISPDPQVSVRRQQDAQAGISRRSAATHQSRYTPESENRKFKKVLACTNDAVL